MRRTEAYFTVEAALILPLVISGLTMTVFLFLFQYDRCLMEQDAGMLALYAGTIMSKDKEETQVLIAGRTASRYMEKYVLWGEDKLDVSIRNRRAEVREEGHLTIPVPEWDFFGGGTGWSAQVTRKITMLSPVEFIRLCKKSGRE